MLRLFKSPILPVARFLYGRVGYAVGHVDLIEALIRVKDSFNSYPLDRLALSTQCGFASGIAGNLLTEDEQWAKIDVMIETARQVWGTA